MAKRMLIDAVHAEESRVVIINNNRIEDFDFVTSTKQQIKGNIYLAKITRVEPSLQAAFVEYGGGRQGFLPFSEIHPDYYQIPISDRKRLLEEQAQVARAEEEAEERGEEGDFSRSGGDTEGYDESRGESEGDYEQSRTDQQDFSSEQPDDVASAKSEFQFDNEQTTPLPDFSWGTPGQPPQQDHVPGAEEPRYAAEQAAEPVAYAEPGQADLPPSLTGDEINYDQPLQSVEGEMLPPSDSGNIEEAPISEEVETLPSEEELVRQARRPYFSRRYRIQEVIKRNQVVLVQVIKEERGNKGVSLTTYVSLAGRYCVLMPNSPKDGGISRKISSGEDRRRLKQISAELRSEHGMSAIIRTVGIDRTRVEIKRDYEYLLKMWTTIREQTLASSAPALIYEESDLVKRSIRDLYNNDIDDIVVEGEEAYNQAKEFMTMLMPSHAPRVKLYTNPTPLFYSYDVEDQLVSMYDSAVKLRSGGYIVINPTEALIAIDVNSGRSTGERNIEETAAKTNLEAAVEIARQVRLRDLAGLLVIDFIDMLDSRNRRAVERALKDALKQDRAKIQIGRISPFGLLELSRQRMRPSISETSTTLCAHCQGKGHVRSHASVSIQILRALKKDASSGAFAELKLTTTSGTAMYLLNSKKDALLEMEKEYGIRVIVQADDNLPQSGFRVEKVKLPGDRQRSRRLQNDERPDSVPVSMDTQSMEANTEYDPEDRSQSPRDEGNIEEVRYGSEEGGSKEARGADGKRRRGRRGGKRRRPEGGDDRPIRSRNRSEGESGGEEGQSTEYAGSDAQTEYAGGEPAPGGDENAERPRERGNRGGRSNPNRDRTPRPDDGAPRGERGGRRRRFRGRGRDDKPRSENQDGSAFAPAYSGESGGGSFAPSSSSSAPETYSFAPSTETRARAQQPKHEPSLVSSSGSASSHASSGGDSGSKEPAKRGWWRRIVES